MNWKLIVALSSLGVALGGVSLIGLPRWEEWAVRLFVGLFAAYVLAMKLRTRHIHHGFIVGFAAGMLAIFVQAFFYDILLARNPDAATIPDNLPSGTDPRQYLLSYAPVIGLLQGIALAVFAWTAGSIAKGSALAQNTKGSLSQEQTQTPKARQTDRGAKPRKRK
ncbi:MAG: hypothetical protein HY532_04785 [Chloroflexi bacterium]|nr:hypothetical protein [Chloroflexota bacterium]